MNLESLTNIGNNVYPVEGCIIVKNIRNYLHFQQAVGNFSFKNKGQSKGQN